MRLGLPCMLGAAGALGAFGVVLAVLALPSGARAASGVWTAAYYNNITLSGAPVLQRDEGADLDVSLDGDPPGPGVRIERFSATWSRSDEYAAGLYRITATADDGIAVFVDGAVVLDEWFDQEATTYAVDIELSAGTHGLGVDYYNGLDKAVVRVRIDALELHDEPSATPVSTQIAEATATPPRPAATPAVTRTAGARTTTSTPGFTTTVVPATASPGAGATTPMPSSTAGPAPRIGCLWALPDMDSAAPGMQYDTEPQSGSHDDDGQVVPDADHDPSNDAQAPCAGPPGSPPAQADGARHLMQVAPNLEDDPEQRRIQLWASIDTVEQPGIASLFWYVYYPDGSTVGGVASDRVVPETCSALAEPPAGPNMFEAAVANGELAPDAMSDPTLGLAALCENDQASLFHGEFGLSNHQPCGEYQFIAVAMGNHGATSALGASFDVLCTTGLRVDFSVVDWGPLSPGQTNVVNGDILFAPPASLAPTVRNVGNDGMSIKLRFGPMTGVLSRTILDTFGACFGRSASLLQCLDPITADATAMFAPDAPRTLCANEAGQLDLSVHPPDSVVDDEFGGAMTIIGYHVSTQCAGDRHLP